MSEKLSKAEYAQKMKDARKKLNDIADEHALDIIRDQKEFVSFLDLYSRMNYTIFNSLLIHAANPDATAIKDFARWKEEGTYVKPKESGIQILEPDGTYMRKDGSVATKYKIKTVFDVSQTDAGIAEPQQYDPKEVRDALIFGEEDAYEGRNLAYAIDYACEAAGEPNDSFTIACAKYCVKHRYGITPNSFKEDVLSYFMDTTTSSGAKSQLREIDHIYRTVIKKIDRGLYVKEMEKANEQQR